MPTDLPDNFPEPPPERKWPTPKPPNRAGLPILPIASVVGVLAMVAALLFTTTFDSFPDALTPSPEDVPAEVERVPMTQAELETFGKQVQSLFGTDDERLVSGILADATRDTGCSVLIYRPSPNEDFSDPDVQKRVDHVARERGDQYVFLEHPILHTMLLVQHCS